jgi:trehalose 6-phosphate phosphatase
MKNILAQANQEVLAQFAWSNALVALDYDGTLAPIVEVPDRATMRPSTRALLRELAKLYPCAVISGRSQADVAGRLQDTGIVTIVGNHGVEPWQATAGIMREVRDWQPRLREKLSGLKGVDIEDKMYSVAVHYRRSREKKRARAAILAAAGSLPDVRVIGGKQVVNILPGGAPHKGIALERERDRLACDTAIYVGDDETDEDVFALDRPGRLLGIRVGARRSSHAAYYIGRQQEIDTLLRRLIALRADARQTSRQVAR